MRFIVFVFLFCVSSLTYLLPAQSDTVQGTVTVDEHGVMRWASGEEVQGFGVNYTVPFAHAFRSAKKLGVDPLQAIDQDVYQFKRLGFDLYRCHVWDTEISDTLGNLLYNEHLHAFDYLLSKLAENGINYVLTPIAYWGGGWPEPDRETPGFSHKYGKDACLTHPGAIKAQENYLTQFMNHINPYTGVAYKDDPHVVAVEISNEPHHGGEARAVTEFVTRMVEAVRKSGYDRPVFYNVSHSVHFINDYFAGGIDGGTFQWYPTGLTYQRELPMNTLPNVDRYHIPFDEDIKRHGGARLVYEFDAADINQTYPYVAMARSFRTAGIQIATHFSYDPTFLAYANTEYNTHYMNLAYTPGKALSLMIAGEVFHQIPLYADYGAYPDNTTFDGFRVSYEEDLAQLNVPETFYYTNTTSDAPVAPERLRHLAGVGDSPVVDYDGTGAYFLDYLNNGVWRLEVMPDALTVQNPFGRNALDKTVGVIDWNKRQMNIALDDLGDQFTLTPLNPGNTYTTKATDGVFTIWPGSYLVTSRPIPSQQINSYQKNHPHLRSFAGPASTVDRDYVVHTPPEMVSSGNDLIIEAQVASPFDSVRVQAVVAGWRNAVIDLEHVAGFIYRGVLPAGQVKPGRLDYYLTVQHAGGARTFPADAEGLPYEWDFYQRQPYHVNVHATGQPLVLFSARDHASGLVTSRWNSSLAVVPTKHPDERQFLVNLPKIPQVTTPSTQDGTVGDYTVRHFTQQALQRMKDQVSNYKQLVIKATPLNDKALPCQIALITRAGNAYGHTIMLEPEKEYYEININQLQPVPLVTLPRPYPTFLPYFFSGSGLAQEWSLADIEAVQWSLGPGIALDQQNQQQGLGISYILLTQKQ